VTPLHVACAWQGSPACARLLIERGADATITDAQHHGTPLGWAAHHGNTAIRNELLEIGSRRDPFIAMVAGRLDRLQALLAEIPPSCTRATRKARSCSTSPARSARTTSSRCWKASSES